MSLEREDKEVDHVGGVTCGDPKTDIKIGDHTIPDWFSSYNSTATAPDRIRYYSHWRFDPLNTLALGLVDVKSGWATNAWLMPYVLAHTSTLWWNHAVRYVMPVTMHDQKTEANSLELVTMPKACTIYVPGNYEHICLVIVDSEDGNYSPTRDYLLGPGDGDTTYRVSWNGTDDFATYAMRYLKRSSGGVKYENVDFVEAWRRMCSQSTSLYQPMSVQVLLSVLCTSRFGGFSVWTDPDKVKKKEATEGTEESLKFLADIGVPSQIHSVPEVMDLMTDAFGDETLSEDVRDLVLAYARIRLTELAGVREDKDIT